MRSAFAKALRACQNARPCRSQSRSARPPVRPAEVAATSGAGADLPARGAAPLGPTLVVGSNGRVGAAVSALLAGAGRVVRGADRVPHGAEPGGRVPLLADACSPDAALAEAVRASSCVVLCLPDGTLPAAIDQILPLLAPGALLVETGSVKTPVAGRLLRSRDDVELVGINPMFSPEVGFAGQDVAAVVLRGGPRWSAFLDVVAGAGARVVELTAEEHDRQTALAQATVHAAILCFGAVVDDAGGVRVSTPPQRALMELVDRVTSRDPAVYWHIQIDNPAAAQARHALGRALAELEAAVVAGDEERFVARFFRRHPPPDALEVAGAGRA